jgi:acetyl esterase/lipase
MDREGDGFGRRALLKTGALAALAGCVSYPDGSTDSQGRGVDPTDAADDASRAETPVGDGETDQPTEPEPDDGTPDDRPVLEPPDPENPLEPRYDVVTHRTTYREPDDTALALEASVPDARGPAPMLVFFADEGWAGGRVIPRDYRDVFTRAGVATVGFEYRGRESASFADPVRDAVAAVRWVRANGPDWELDPDRVTLVGRDTGAHVAALVAAAGTTDQFQPPDYDADADVEVHALVGRAGIYDLRREDACESPYGDFLGEDCGSEDTQLAASPAARVDEDHPPTLLFHGSEDEVVSPEESRAYSEALQDAGLPVGYREMEGEGHDFMQDEDRARAVDEDTVRFSFEAWGAAGE